jgi:hypothetical protein
LKRLASPLPRCRMWKGGFTVSQDDLIWHFPHLRRPRCNPLLFQVKCDGSAHCGDVTLDLESNLHFKNTCGV